MAALCNVVLHTDLLPQPTNHPILGLIQYNPEVFPELTLLESANASSMSLMVKILYST